MLVDVVMPKMGESLNEGTIIKWHKKVGDRVKKDEIIFEISTDKVDTEIPSPVEGTVTKINFAEQEVVEIETVVAVIETEDENLVIDETSRSVEETVNKEEVEIKSVQENEFELVDIPMPKMGESVQDGTIIKWRKKVGDNVSKDEIIFEISTDKVDTEVPSPVNGVMAEILFDENETVDVDIVVARISTSGKIPAERKQERKPSETPSQKSEPAVSRITKTDGKKSTSRFYSPLVLNIAQKENVSFDELNTIQGSGLSGRVNKNDILNFISTREKGGLRKEKTPAAKISHSGERVEVIPMDNIRLRIKEHMIKSRDTSVHVSEVMEVDMTLIHNYIEKNKERLVRDENLKLTYMPFISFAVVKSLKEFPLMNASVEGDNIIQKKYVNLGIAVAVEPNGLIVPNIKNADEMSIRGLAKAIADIGSRARNKGLTLDDISDGTFSITNYGVFGALFGNPIINQPEVAILGVGAVQKKPVVIEVNGQETIGIKPMMYLSLSHDHRLVDGMLGGKFLKAVKDTLENFDTTSI